MIVPAELQVFKVAHQEGAIGDKIYRKYRLSADMQQEIRNQASFSDLDFSDSRFQIQEMGMKQSERKRNIQSNN
jgi:hypothetical protein